MDCTLCGLQSASTILDGERHFCCFGCRTVWHLLAAKGISGEWRDHPIFEQAIKSGLISNPALVFEAKEGVEKRRLTFEVREMWCPSCAEVVEYLLRLEKGVIECHVDYATDLAAVDYDPCQISEEEIFKFIASLGYQPVNLENVLGKPVSSSLRLRFFVAAFAALNVMMFSYPLYATYFDFAGGETAVWGPVLAWLSAALSLPVMIYSAGPIWSRFFNSLKTGLYGMESLVVIGISSAFLLSMINLWQGETEVYFDTLTVIVAFVLLGKMIEAKAKFSAKEAFYTLSRSLPQRGRRGGEFVSLKEIVSGDVLEVVAGEKFVLDGMVERGTAWVDESSMTGESLPKLKTAGDRVLAGTVLETGHLFFKVEGQNSSLSVMTEVCKFNLENKSLYIRALDPFIKAFVPLVLVLAIGVVLGGGSFKTALAVLLISCPCAIGIAAPLVESSLMRLFAQKGAIIRNRGALALLPRVSLFAFDKTGTITCGEFAVKGLEEMDEDSLKALKGLALRSRHPIAASLASQIKGEGTCFEAVLETEGAGLQAEGVLLGSRAYISQYVPSERLEWPKCESTKTEVFFYDGKKVWCLQLSDKIRPEVPRLIAALPKTSLLSGDRSSVVKSVAEELGFSQWAAELTPLQKIEKIKALKQQGEIVLFTGDGLNDAPALTEAHIGVAVASGQGLSQAAADILLTQNSLTLLPEIIALAKLGRRRIRQNLFWAFIYNLIGLPLALFSLMNPILAALAMTLSSLIVLLNSFRLKDPE